MIDHFEELRHDMADTIVTSLPGKCMCVCARYFFLFNFNFRAIHLRKSLEISVNTVESIISFAGPLDHRCAELENSKYVRIQFDFDYFYL